MEAGGWACVVPIQPSVLCAPGWPQSLGFGARLAAARGKLIFTRGQCYANRSLHRYPLRDFTMEQLDSGGADPETFLFPRPLRLAARRADYELEGDFVVARPFHVSDIEQRLPGFLRGVSAALFKHPVLYRLQGYFRGTLQGPRDVYMHMHMHAIIGLYENDD